MKRIRDLFRGPRSFRLRCFHPRCLCAEDDDTRSQSDDKVYQIAVYPDACEKREPKAPPKPSGPSIRFVLPGQCDDTITPEDLNVPEESHLKPQDEARLDAFEVSSVCDLPVSEEEPHNLTESEIKTEDEELSDPSESNSYSDLPESPEDVSIHDEDTRSQSDDKVYQIAVYPDACETPEPKATPKPSGSSIRFVVPGHCDDTNTPEDLNVPEELHLEPQDETRLDAQEATSVCDLPESPEDIGIQEEPAREPEPALEKPDETEVKALNKEDDIPRASADGRIQRRFPVSMQDFRCCAVVGQGSFGKVLLAEYKKTQNMVAIKAIKKAAIIRRAYAERLGFEKDILQTMSSIRHPFLVNLFACFQDEHYIVFVMEYAAGGDLKHNMDGIVGSEHRVKFYAACIVLGLECLHQNKIVHRDLKLENVVLDNEGFARLTDFGLSKSGMGFRDRTKSIVGTPVYMAPEMVTRQEYTRDVDWWSLGVVIYSMLGVKMPFDANTMKKLHNKIVNGEVAYPDYWSPECVSLISQLLVKNPTWRLGSGQSGAEDVKAHRFFRNIEWRKLLRKELRPPFLPRLSGPGDVSNFDEKVTSTAPDLTPPQGPGLTEEQQELFRGFEWTAEWTP